MTGKTRFLAALTGAPLDYVPRWDLECHLFDALAPHPLQLGQTFAKLSARQQEHALQQNAETLYSVARQCGYDAMTLPNNYWEIAPGVPAYYWLPENARFRQMTLIRELAGDDIALVTIGGGLIMAPSDAGYADFCYRLYDEPEAVEETAEHALLTGIAGLSIMRDHGIDVVVNACDVADNHGIFFSPPQLARFWTPYLIRWAAAVRERGMLSILHSDGNLTDILEMLAESGLHGLQAIDPTAGMHLAQVKARVGNRLTLCGNIDCGLLITGSPEQVYAETLRTMREGKDGGRFILGASNAVQQEVPLPNFFAMQQAWMDTRDYRPENAPG